MNVTVPVTMIYCDVTVHVTMIDRDIHCFPLLDVGHRFYFHLQWCNIGIENRL